MNTYKIIFTSFLFWNVADAVEKCLVKTSNKSEMVLCKEYCCGNQTYQFCCSDCHASVNSFRGCGFDIIVTGLVLTFLGLVILCLMITICATLYSDKPTSPATRSQVGVVHISTISRVDGMTVPQFLLPVLPNYSECCARTPPPPFEVVLSSELPPVQTSLEQVGGSDAITLQRSQTSESTRTLTRQEFFPTSPPPDYQTINIIQETHANLPIITDRRQSIN
ncbi:hypothetical protein EG68_08018 [Paragonimus skrjabini miyazakii]|uniref:Uncharacterized protein n=1 Tax=Paragonimus skrjabini miyazakii TaxID=59628 RepID=A0A8S9Z0W7_9TREM|nr:hypothetical protein EG68_08018 [Paragonimus skrjabini miyazakii]